MRQSGQRRSPNLRRCPFLAVGLLIPVRLAILVGLGFLSVFSDPHSVGSAFHTPDGPGIWRPIPAAGAPTARSGPTAVGTGRDMLVWGGQVSAGYGGDG